MGETGEMAVVRAVKKAKGVTLSVWLPENLAMRIDAIAAREGITRSKATVALLEYAVRADETET
jgi:metal-responsive CopG/Arc/MetJ family transcriptional regulator